MRQLPPNLALMPLHEIRERRRDFSHLQVATSPQLESYILRNILRPPAFRCVEGNDPNGIFVLS